MVIYMSSKQNRLRIDFDASILEFRASLFRLAYFFIYTQLIFRQICVIILTESNINVIIIKRMLQKYYSCVTFVLN